MSATRTTSKLRSGSPLVAFLVAALISAAPLFGSLSRLFRGDLASSISDFGVGIGIFLVAFCGILAALKLLSWIGRPNDHLTDQRIGVPDKQVDRRRPR